MKIVEEKCYDDISDEERNGKVRGYGVFGKGCPKVVESSEYNVPAEEAADAIEEKGNGCYSVDLHELSYKIPF